MTTQNAPGAPAPNRLSRRSFLGRSAAGSAGIVLAGGVSGLFGTASARPGPPRRRGGYGPLVDDPAGLLSLPARLLLHDRRRSPGVTTLESGEPTPSDPDGTASFVRHGGNGSVLVVNHEVGGSEPYPVPRIPGLRLRPGGRRRHDDHRGRQATATACASTSASPARTTTARAAVAVGHVADLRGGREPSAADQAARLRLRGRPLRPGRQPRPEADQGARPLRARGARRRPATRARSTSPRTPASPNGLLYRWTPPASALPLGKGVAARRSPTTPATLEALKAPDARRRARPRPLGRDRRPARPTASRGSRCPTATPQTRPTRKQFANGQITRSRKLEGMWWGDGGAYFVCSFARIDRRQRRPARRPGLVPRPARTDDRAQAALRLHADGPGRRPRRARQHHGLGLRRRDHRRGRRRRTTSSARPRAARRSSSPATTTRANSEFTGPTSRTTRRSSSRTSSRPATCFAITGPWTGHR